MSMLHILHSLLIFFLGLVTGKNAPNMIIIMCDDLGYGDTGFQGNWEIKTPHLDKLAHNGALLKRFHSAGPVCSPTRASVLTGRHYFRVGVLDANVGRLQIPEHSIASTMAKSGYITSITGKWHVGALSQQQYEANRLVAQSYPQWHGFNYSFVTQVKVTTFNPFGPDGSQALTSINPYFENGVRVVDRLVGDDSKIIMDRTLPFIEQQVAADKPFLSIVWFHTPHMPCVAPPRFVDMYKHLDVSKRHYFGAISAMDEQVGVLMDRLRSLSVENNTLIWFFSDNGPESNIRGQHLGSTNGLRGRKRSLYNGGITVPSFVHWPDVIQPQTVIDTPISALDVYPTLVKLATSSQVQIANGKVDVTHDELPLDGEDIMPILTGVQNVRSKDIPFSYHHPQTTTHALISYPYKILVNLMGDRSTAELYDIRSDIFERKNIVKGNEEILQGMIQSLEKWVISVGNSFSGNDYLQSQYSKEQISKHGTYIINKNYSLSNVISDIKFSPDWQWQKINKCPQTPVNSCIGK